MGAVGALLLNGAIWVAENYGPQLVTAWLKGFQKPPPAAPSADPADQALGKVRAATAADRHLDTSDQAVTDDPNNRNRPR